MSTFQCNVVNVHDMYCFNIYYYLLQNKLQLHFRITIRYLLQQKNTVSKSLSIFQSNSKTVKIEIISFP